MSTAVRPDKLLAELNKFAKPVAEGGVPALRACSMTLVVIVDDEDNAADLSETLMVLMKAHPSRTIVVRLRDGHDELEGHASAQCWKPVGHAQEICCEQIELTASVNRLADIPSIVEPLRVPDLPSVVWFRSSLISRAPDLSGVLALGRKVIVDSSRVGSPSFADLRILSASGYAVGDLAWTRLTALRQLVAQLLEHRDLTTVKNVIIEHCGAEAGAEAKYLQAWLRASLPAASVDFEKNGEPGTGKIRRLRMDPDIAVTVNDSCADYASGALKQRANLSSGSEHGLLNEELSIMKRDSVFEKALQRMTIWTPRAF